MIDPFVSSAALVEGYAARALSALMRDLHFEDRIRMLPSEMRPVVLGAVRAIDRAGDEWLASRVSAVGNSETPVAEMGASFDHDLSIPDAAVMLGVTDRRARQLAAAGLGRKVGAVWVLDRSAVLAEIERRRAA